MNVQGHLQRARTGANEGPRGHGPLCPRRGARLSVGALASPRTRAGRAQRAKGLYQGRLALMADPQLADYSLGQRAIGSSVFASIISNLLYFDKRSDCRIDPILI